MAALGWPSPLSDDDRGGDARYDVYLQEGAAPAVVPDEIPTGGAWDRASAFSVLSPPDVSAGCAFDAAVARTIAGAVALRFDAGVEASVLAMAESHLAASIVDCYVDEDAAIDDFQRDPERSFARSAPDAPAGSMLFARFLDDHHGSGVPGAVLLGLLAVSGQRTPASALEFSNEPDVFDALRSNARSRDKPFEDLLLDFAIARAFVGSRSDGAHLSDVETFGDFGRVRFEWTIPWSTLPRRLAPMRPIEPTGATYLWIDLAGAPEDGELGFVADWELGVLFHWALVKIDASGAEVGRVRIGGINGATHVERTLVGLRGLSGILVVGTNVGSIDRSHPYDPDEPATHPRGYTVMLVK